MKNQPKGSRRAREGRARSPYAKHGKKPFNYTFMYRALDAHGKIQVWKGKRITGYAPSPLRLHRATMRRAVA